MKALRQISRKKVTVIALKTLGILVFIASVGFTDQRQSSSQCTGVNITIHDSSGLAFIEEEDIRQILANKFGSAEGKELRSINISLLEKIIYTNPFISEAEVFSTVDGKLNIEVNQRTPLLRIINFSNESFYIDDQGKFMPLSEKYSARVPVVNGFVFEGPMSGGVKVYSPDERNSETKFSKTDQVFHIATYLSKDEFWNAQIEQYHINAEGDIEIIPRVGDHLIIVGDHSGLEEKFAKLKLFYKEGLNKTGWNKYSVINLKYKDQVVCSKN